MVLRADMRVYAHNHQGFVADLAKQLATALGIDAGKSKLETLLENHAQGKTVCIFLHHFDVLLNNTQIAGQYDISFFNQLNAWRNRVNCKLLCDLLIVDRQRSNKQNQYKSRGNFKHLGFSKPQKYHIVTL